MLNRLRSFVLNTLGGTIYVECWMPRCAIKALCARTKRQIHTTRLQLPVDEGLPAGHQVG
jgi:hypothetical protein